MPRATQINKGNVINWRDQLWRVTDTQQTFIGKKGAYIQMKLQNLDDGHTEQHRFSSDDDVEKAYVETRRMEYLYQDGPSYVFMDPRSGQQVYLGEDIVEGCLPYLSYNTEVDVVFHEDTPIDVELPASVTLEVTSTDPAVRGDTATSVTKPAEVETGLTVKVPGHVEEGDKIQVDTRTGEFLGRA